MKEIAEQIKDNRPNLSDNSLKTYVSTLKNLYKKVYPEDETINLKKFNNHTKFLNFLKDVDGSKRKTILSALVVFCKDDCEPYREVMIQDAKQYNEEQKEQKMTESQKENWISQDEIMTIYKKYESQARKLMKMDELSMAQLQQIQNWIIIALTSGIFIEPRRSTDWTEMKIKNYNKESDNFYDKKKFVFNKYKTAKIYKTQSIETPNELKKILSAWVKINPTDYLLFDVNKNPLSPVKLTQRNNNIYDGKISVNMLRHSFVSDKYIGKSIPSLKEINDTAKNMGHSLNQHLEYIKLENGDEEAEKEIKHDIKVEIKEKEKKRGGRRGVKKL